MTLEDGDARRNNTVWHQTACAQALITQLFLRLWGTAEHITAGGTITIVFGFERNHAKFCLIDNSCEQRNFLHDSKGTPYRFSAIDSRI